MLAMAEYHVRVHNSATGTRLDSVYDILFDRRPRPEEFSGLPVQRVDEPGLSGYPGNHPALLARFDGGIDPGHFSGGRCNGRIDQQTLEWMIEIPVIDDVLKVPDDLAGIDIESQRRIVIQMRLVDATEQEFRCRYRH